jgi:hypothetical protein
LTDIGINGLVFADAVRIERLAAVQTESAVPTLSPPEFDLTNAEVAPLLQRAVDTWTAADQNAQGRLSSVNLVIGQLPGSVLGLASEPTSTIWLDSNGAGSGWQLESNALRRGDASLSPGRFDLFTVVAHELGHLLGYGDLDPLAHPDALMASHLSVGARKLPAGMGLDTLPKALTAPAAKDAYFVDVGRSSNRVQDELFGLVLEPNRVPGDVHDSEWSMCSALKQDPKDGSRAVAAASNRRHAVSGNVVTRKHEALVDEFFDHIDDELLRPETNITAES